jgi:hypothetical protein
MTVVRNLLLAFLLCVYTNVVFAYELGVSSSGEDVSLDFWQSKLIDSELGMYFRLIIDSEEYENGNSVSVCRDGSISGSFGSGTCSSHGGVSHSKLADFNRLAFAIGPTYWISESIQLHGGLLWAMYTSDISIGDHTKLDFDEFGIDLGVSLEVLDQHRLSIMLSHETEQKRNYIGVRFLF